MKTILEPTKSLVKLLGNQKLQAGESYRLMTFVVQSPVADGLLLFHNMTKEMLLLSKEEQKVFEQCPTDLSELINRWFLVPIDHDDCKLSNQLNHVACMIEQPKNGIVGYTVMTTSDCNARCFYCYELGQKRRPMTDETANKAADYIIRHAKGEAVSIEWFGGEPLYNKSVINLICNKLREANINYSSSMISNGYLMDADTVKEAHDLWKLKHIQITIDGTEQTYNRVKAYIYKDVNAYQRVMDNIGHLLKADISVSIRMNMDTHNANELETLAKELHERFSDSKDLSAYLHLLFEDKLHRAGVFDDNKRKALFERMRQIQEKLQGWGLFKYHSYQSTIRTTNCMADNDSCVVIQPDGYITKCEHYTDSHRVGHIDDEVFDTQMIDYFKERTSEPLEDCKRCAKYPSCVFLKGCPHYKECYPEMPEMFQHEMQQEMHQLYDDFLKREEEINTQEAASKKGGKHEV